MQRPVWLLILSLFSFAPRIEAADLRIGMIGLDTSHVIAFTSLLNNPQHGQHVPGGRVVAAFKGGSPDVEASRTRVDKFTEQLSKEYDVKIVPTIEALCEQVDAIMIESVDGRPHLEQARPVIKAKKRLFLDKPAAGSLKDVLAIYQLAKENDVPVFSSSSLRYYPGLVELKAKEVGELKGAFSIGPAELEPHHPDLFWYGVHAAEALYTIMGKGCQSVVRTSTPDTDVVTGLWDGGRVGTLRGIRNASTPYRVTVFGSKGVFDQKPGGDYAPLLKEVIKFFETGVAPVKPEETIELFAFMEAADESKRRGGAPVKLEEVLAKAKE